MYRASFCEAAIKSYIGCPKLPWHRGVQFQSTFHSTVNPIKFVYVNGVSCTLIIKINNTLIFNNHFGLYYSHCCENIFNSFAPCIWNSRSKVSKLNLINLKRWEHRSTWNVWFEWIFFAIRKQELFILNPLLSL